MFIVFFHGIQRQPFHSTPELRQPDKERWVNLEVYRDRAGIFLYSSFFIILWIFVS